MPFKITAPSVEKYKQADDKINSLPDAIKARVIEAEINQFSTKIKIDTSWSGNTGVISILKNPMHISIGEEFTTCCYDDIDLIYRHENVKKIVFIEPKSK